MKTMPTLRNAIETLAAILTISPALHGQTLNTLHSFGYNALGRQPFSGVIFGQHGEIYGTTPSRIGPNGVVSNGVLYELVPPTSPAGEWTEVVLHFFSSQNIYDGPRSEPLIGPGGALYGVTGYGTDGGTVFQLKPPAGTGTHWRKTVLHTFGSSGDGVGPSATPVFGPRRALYGTTTGGGTISGTNNGTVYRLLPLAQQGGAWTEGILYSFQGKAGDGAGPVGGLVFGNNGTIYGATAYGGALLGGTIFQLTPPAAPGGGWTETLLYSFGTQSGDARLPNGVVLGPGGILYGTAMGNSNPRFCLQGCGTVFQLSPPVAPGGAWTEAILHTFHGNPAGDGSQPNSPPVLGPNGELYGTTMNGGPLGGNSFGTIYELVPPPSPGGSWTEVVLYRFTGGADGSAPNAVTLGPDGNLYGTTWLGGVSQGGIRNQGTVFQLVLP